jgi:cell wall-associated NlpC family hydrolase
MNRLIKKIGYGTLALILALSGVLNITNVASAQATPACKVTSARFFNHPINAGSLDLLNSSDPTATLRITSENCGGRSGAVFLTEIDGLLNDPIPGGFSFDFNSSGTTNIELIIGEMLCDNGSTPDCKVGGEVSIKSTSNAGPTYVGTPFKFLDSGEVLLYDCKVKDDCKNTTVWKKVVTGNSQGVGTCLITDARFLNNATTPANLKILNSGNPAATLEITGDGCVGWKAFITLKEIDEVGTSALVGSNYEVSFDAAGKKARADFTVGEKACDDRSTPDCAVAAVVTPFRDNAGQPRSYGEMKEFLEFQKSLQYNCKTVDNCKNDQDWIFGAPSTTIDRCSIISAEFDPSSDGSSTTMSDGSTGVTGPRFYNYLHRPSAIITIETKNCATKPIIVTLLQHESVGYDEHISALDEKKLFVPEGEIITIGMKTGEDYCGPTDLGCEFYLKVSPSPAVQQDIYVSLDKPRGKMTYGCDHARTLLQGMCSDKWEYISDNALKVDSNGVPITDGGVLGDPNSACLDENGKPIEGCYEVYGQLGDLLKDRLNLLDNKFDTLKQDSLGGLINAIIAIATGIAGVIAVGMIIYQGFLIMKTDNVATHTEAKSRIGKTILGFLLLLGIFVILRTINPDLLNLNPAIKNVTFDTGGDTEYSTTTQPPLDLKTKASDYGISCPGSGGAAAIPTVAQSFVGKVTYQFGAKGSPGPSNTIAYDCSGFVAAVYSCVGLASPGGGTYGIFTGAPTISSITSTKANGQDLKVGDLIGWTAGSLTKGKKEENGHVTMYIGNGKVIESRGNNKSAGKAINIQAADAYVPRLKFLKRAP